MWATLTAMDSGTWLYPSPSCPRAAALSPNSLERAMADSNQRRKLTPTRRTLWLWWILMGMESLILPLPAAAASHKCYRSLWEMVTEPSVREQALRLTLAPAFHHRLPATLTTIRSQTWRSLASRLSQSC